MSKKIKIILALLIGLSIVILSKQVYAASASISAGKTSLEPGQSTTIAASVSETEAWNLKVTASGGTLSGEKASADAAGSEVSQQVISATFTASTEGTYTITLSGDIAGKEDVDNEKSQKVSKSVTITVKKAQVTPPPTEPTTPPKEPDEPTTPTKSSNANLSNLGIRPNDFSGFRASNTNYNVSVPYDVSSIEVYAYKGDSAQTISGTGKKSLSEGSNLFEVKVTAEDGTVKVYKITVVRLAKESEPTPDVENSPVTKVALNSLEIKDATINEPFNPETLEYTANVGSDVEKIEITAVANILDAKVEIQGADNLKEGENIVKVIITSADGEDVKEYTIKVTKAESEVIAETEENNNEVSVVAGITDNNNNPPMDKKTIILLSVLGIAIIGVSILTIILFVKNRKENNKEGAIDFIGDISPTKSIKDAKNSLEKLNSTTLETAETEDTFAIKKKGRHF